MRMNGVCLHCDFYLWVYKRRPSEKLSDSLVAKKTVLTHHTAWGALEDSLETSKKIIGLLRAFGASQ
jgi:hypothetical protein